MTNSQLKQYLLGNLDEQTEAEIGLQVFTDESSEERLLIAENDLMEDFLDKNLTSEEEKLFHDNFLVCDDREKQLAEIYSFKQFSKQRLAAEKSGEPEKQKESFWQKLKNSDFKLQIAAPILAIVLIAAVIGFYLVPKQTALSPLENEYAELNRQNLSNPDEFSRFSNISLISETYRSNADSTKLKTENLSGQILFRLAILFNIPENELSDVEVLKDEKVIFRQTKVRVYKNTSGQEFRLLLPKEIFSKGRYRIKIENSATQNSAVTYDFAVE